MQTAAGLDRDSALAGGHPILPGARPEPGIVHLGLSNFHRAHQAVYTARALQYEDGPWGIVGVARSSRDVIEAMRAQQGIYGVLTLDGDEVRTDLIGVHAELIRAADDFAAVAARIADPAVRIVTITVTEAGYTFDPAGLRLDLGRPELAADLSAGLTGGAPRTTIGQLATALSQRFRAGGEPLTIMSCDNLVGNGDLTRSLVEEFWTRSVAEPELGELLAWSERRVGFPNAMVDRIVPRTTDRLRVQATMSTGLADYCPVPAEPFSMWVVEDAFVTDRPAWEQAGVIISDDVHGYETLKIRLLNGTHSLIAYLGLLLGAETIDQAIADPDVRAAAEAFLDEMVSTLRVPAGVSLDDYRDSLFRRFGNVATGHRTSQVGSDGSLKLAARIPAPVAIRSVAGQPSPMAALLAAAFTQVVTEPAAVPTAIREGLRDPASGLLRQIGADVGSAAGRLDAVVVRSGLFPAELADEEEFLERARALARTLSGGGVRAAIADVLGG